MHENQIILFGIPNTYTRGKKQFGKKIAENMNEKIN